MFSQKDKLIYQTEKIINQKEAIIFLKARKISDCERSDRLSVPGPHQVLSENCCD